MMQELIKWDLLEIKQHIEIVYLLGKSIKLTNNSKVRVNKQQTINNYN